jgi:hypothetical protein
MSFTKHNEAVQAINFFVSHGVTLPERLENEKIEELINLYNLVVKMTRKLETVFVLHAVKEIVTFDLASHYGNIDAFLNKVEELGATKYIDTRVATIQLITSQEKESAEELFSRFLLLLILGIHQPLFLQVSVEEKISHN